jgi:purine-binding chemotaxis protein CheW
MTHQERQSRRESAQKSPQPGSTVGLVLVRMAGRACAIPCTRIVEIVPRVDLSPIPDAPSEVLGVINLRGRIVPIVDVRQRVAQDERPLVPYQHLVIVEAAERQLGLAVDEVNDVLSVEEHEVARPGELAGARAPGVVRIGNEIVLVLEPEDVVHAAR